MKKWFVLGMAALFLLTVGTSSTCSAMASAEKDVVAKEVLEVIEGYYAYAYGAICDWDSKELPDLSPYMHMEEVQCQNTSMYVASCIFNRVFVAEELRRDPPDTLYPYNIELLSVEQPSVTEAVARIKLDLDLSEAYPLFMLRGENTFKLRYDGGRWKITQWQSEENKDTPLIKASFSTVELKESIVNEDFNSSYEEAKIRIRKNKLGIGAPPASSLSYDTHTIDSGIYYSFEDSNNTKVWDVVVFVPNARDHVAFDIRARDHNTIYSLVLKKELLPSIDDINLSSLQEWANIALSQLDKADISYVSDYVTGSDWPTLCALALLAYMIWMLSAPYRR